MKSVLISIRPKWCELIASGRKTIEERKTRPKLETPFKCYIYCTKYDEHRWGYDVVHVPTTFNGFGKVIGEFVCDTFIKDMTCGHDPLTNGAACLSEEEASRYADGKIVYGWHISDLTIYDRPRGLWEFQREETTGAWSRFVPFTRPPQSWCYVEEVTQDD